MPRREGSAGRRIQLATQTTRPSHAGAMRVIKGIKKPAAAKFDGRKAHRRVLTPEPELGLVPIVAPNGLFYSHAVGAFGVVFDGGDWDRLAIAVHRWELKLVENNDIPMLLFPDDARVLEESEISDGSFLVVIFFLILLGYPISGGISWAGISLDR